MPANTYGRQVVVPLTNKSGGGVIAGDVVVIDTTNNDAFTTNTAGAFTGAVGIAQETIASNAVGRVLLSGYAALVNVNASVTRGNYGKTYTVAKQATDAGAARAIGTFCQFLTGGTTPDAIVYPVDLAGTALTNPMDGTGQLIYGGSAGAPTKLAAGTATQLLHGSATVPSWSGLAVADILTAAIDNLLPWHVFVIPMVATPDASTGTWSTANADITSGNAHPFYTIGSVANSGGATYFANVATGAQNDAISYDVVLSAGTWDANFWVQKGSAAGIITLNQDTVSQGTVDTYNATPIAAKVSITGWTVSTTGKHTMQMKAATKNGSSSAYRMVFFGIEFRRTA